ncbi:MAG: hypothetical protein PHN78_02375 [Dehalococcoidales bacterium]|nr:hypothetical protein [Dehalococcoidales bacterium]
MKVNVGKIPYVSAWYHIITVPTVLIPKEAQPVETLLGRRLETNEVQE